MRILTNRNFADGSVEWIDFDDGWFMWRGDDVGARCGFGFPVPQEFVAEKFVECGRSFDPDKLPRPAKWKRYDERLSSANALSDISEIRPAMKDRHV